MYTLYGDSRSGHCYKIQLLCSLLNIEYEWIEVDLLKKQHLSDEFVAISPQHKVPALVIENDNTDIKQRQILLESNAILFYLTKTHTVHSQYPNLIPDDTLVQTQMLQWQFYEQSQFQPPISAIRWIKHYQNMPAERADEYQQKLPLAQENFTRLNDYLSQHIFLVNDTFSLADITLFAYAHIADKGGIDFTNYPNVVAWFQRIQELDGFIAMNH